MPYHMKKSNLLDHWTKAGIHEPFRSDFFIIEFQDRLIELSVNP